MSGQGDGKDVEEQIADCVEVSNTKYGQAQGPFNFWLTLVKLFGLWDRVCILLIHPLPPTTTIQFFFQIKTGKEGLGEGNHMPFLI